MTVLCIPNSTDYVDIDKNTELTTRKRTPKSLIEPINKFFFVKQQIRYFHFILLFLFVVYFAFLHSEHELLLINTERNRASNRMKNVIIIINLKHIMNQ